MYSISNATDKIKRKLLLGYKNVLTRIYCMDIADPKTLFKELLSPLDVGGELVFDDEMLDQTLHSDQRRRHPG